MCLDSCFTLGLVKGIQMFPKNDGKSDLSGPFYIIFKWQKTLASSGNRTRAARVAGEHSTTEPTMLTYVS